MPITHPADELLTTASAAQIAGVVPDTFRMWQRLGRVVPAFVTPTNVKLYRRADVERLAAERFAQMETKSAGGAGR